MFDTDMNFIYFVVTLFIVGGQLFLARLFGADTFFVPSAHILENRCLYAT